MSREVIDVKVEITLPITVIVRLNTSTFAGTSGHYFASEWAARGRKSFTLGNIDSVEITEVDCGFDDELLPDQIKAEVERQIADVKPLKVKSIKVVK